MSERTSERPTVRGRFAVSLGGPRHQVEANRLDAITPDPRGPNWWSGQVRHHCNVLYVATADGLFAGFALAAIEGDEIRLLRVAVDPRFRRKGLGGMLLAKVEARLRLAVPKLLCEVREVDTDLQLFLRASGFRCDRFERSLKGPATLRFVKRTDEAYEPFRLIGEEGQVVHARK